MADKSLTLKLDQLEGRMNRLRSCIVASRDADRGRLCLEKDALRQEFSLRDAELKDSLRLCKSPYVAVLSEAYQEIEKLGEDISCRLQDMLEACPDRTSRAEARLLTAEYVLDFAQQAADIALLISLGALEAEMDTGEKGSE